MVWVIDSAQKPILWRLISAREFALKTEKSRTSISACFPGLAALWPDTGRGTLEDVQFSPSSSESAGTPTWKQWLGRMVVLTRVAINSFLSGVVCAGTTEPTAYADYFCIGTSPS
jgi:hypothetical protein